MDKGFSRSHETQASIDFQRVTKFVLKILKMSAGLEPLSGADCSLLRVVEFLRKKFFRIQKAAKFVAHNLLNNTL